MRVADSILDLIGETPLVAISQLSPARDVRLWLKLEGQNPTGAVKDRVALSMVNAAESAGRLKPGDTLLEPTSGNTGIALAMIAAIRGYRLKAVMPENVSVERRQLLEMYGGEVILSPGDEGSNGSVRLAQKLSADHDDYVFLNQYENEANVDAHLSGTGPEIWRDCPQVSAFVAGLGTGGTLTGVGRFLKEKNPDVKIVAAEPPAGELVQGLRSLDDGYTPPIFDSSVLDSKVIVRPAPSIEYSRRLLSECGIFAGLSTGAAIHAAVRYGERAGEGDIVVLSPDGGWKYLSTGVWTGDLDTASDKLAGTIYF